MVSHFLVKVKTEAKVIMFCNAPKCILMTTVAFTPLLPCLFRLSGSFRISLRIQIILLNGYIKYENSE